MKLSFGLFLLSANFCTAEPERDYGHSFGNIKKQLIQTKDFLENLSVVKNAIQVSSNNDDDNKSRRMKTKAGKSGKKDKKTQRLEEKLDTCEAENAELKQPSLLGIQTADSCQIKRTITGGMTSYQLVSDTVSDDTYLFADRPSVFEAKIPTLQFIDGFDEIFGDSPPNTGLTLTSKDSGEDIGPFVVSFEDANLDNSGVLTYDIRQSPNQKDVLSIETVFVGTDSDSVTFDNCSYFIDNWLKRWTTCPICRTAVALLENTGSAVTCYVACIGIVEAAGGGPEDPVADIVVTSCPILCDAVFSVATGDIINATNICESASLC